MRTVLLAVVGFVTPIALSLVLSSYFFGHWASSFEFLARGSKSSPLGTLSDGRLDALDSEAYRGQPSATITSRANLDPAPDQNFLVSFYVRLDQSLDLNKRQHLLGKYAFRAPYEGWAVGVRRVETSLRPEVYWRGPDGSGGWYAFDEMQFIPNEWYAFTVTAKPGEYLNLFYQQVPGGPVAASEGLQNDSPVVFAGGYDLATVVTPRTDDDFKLGIRRPDTLRFAGEVRDVLVSYPKRLPKSFEKYSPFINGGAVRIVGQLKEEEVNLWSASRAG